MAQTWTCSTRAIAAYFLTAWTACAGHAAAAAADTRPVARPAPAGQAVATATRAPAAPTTRPTALAAPVPRPAAPATRPAAAAVAPAATRPSAGEAKAPAATSPPATRPAEAPPPLIDAADKAALAAHKDQRVMVVGTVKSAAWSVTGKVMNVEFADSPLVVAVFERSRAAVDAGFGGDAATAWAGAKVTVTGKLGEYGGKAKAYLGRPQIVVSSPRQVVVAEGKK